MNFQVIAPPAALRNYVRHFWILENRTDDLSEKAFTVMCNGAPGIIFQEDPRAFTGFEGEQLPQLFVFGQAKKYGQLRCSGSFRTIGVNFQPTALKAVFGLDANELTQQNTCITQLTSTLLTEQLMDCSTVQQQIACFSSFLLGLAHRGEGDDKKVEYAVSAIQRGEQLSRVLRDLNLSERSLERLFHTHVGITPILFARIARFQHSLSLLRQNGSLSLTDIAHSTGYYDQSHFIRDFKLFSGASPGIYQRNTIERMPGFPEWQS
ncbi:helix-turn-helix domain-containing protein [Chitinophaga sp. 212800010-3]|uniref:AraC family transcriptional regulator n=1 Tax=unclassified Chitinophaga TaxID=2619133 RepID=UPI002DE9B2DC|nr:Transcriptional regulator, AraC family [Chitinophaga sp. 212800010-3]